MQSLSISNEIHPLSFKSTWSSTPVKTTTCKHHCNKSSFVDVWEGLKASIVAVIKQKDVSLSTSLVIIIQKICMWVSRNALMSPVGKKAVGCPSGTFLHHFTDIHFLTSTLLCFQTLSSPPQ
jgi:hypothetical protein